MLRTLIYLLLSIFLITFLRGVIGLIGKAVAQLFQPASPAGSGGGSTVASKELKQCAACGVYISEATALRDREDGKVLYFCSPACRQKHRA